LLTLTVGRERRTVGTAAASRVYVEPRR